MSVVPSDAGFGVTAEDIRAYEWQSVLATASRRECYAYNETLLAKATTFQAGIDDRGHRVFRLLGAVASFWPNFHSDESPFRPMAIREGRRSPIPEDLSAADLDALAGVLNEIQDAEFRARAAVQDGLGLPGFCLQEQPLVQFSPRTADVHPPG